MSVSTRSAHRPGEVVAGYLASAAIFFSLIGLVYRPVRILPVTIVLALVAAGIGGRHGRLAAFALGLGGVYFVGGLTIAVLAGKPLW